LFGALATPSAAAGTHLQTVSLFGPIGAAPASGQVVAGTPAQPLQASIAAEPFGPQPNFGELRRLAESSPGTSCAIGSTATASAVVTMATATPSRSGSALQTRGLLPRSAAKVRPRQQLFPQAEAAMAPSLAMGSGLGLADASSSSSRAAASLFSDAFHPLESIKKLVIEPITGGESLYDMPPPPPPPQTHPQPQPITLSPQVLQQVGETTGTQHPQAIPTDTFRRQENKCRLQPGDPAEVGTTGAVPSSKPTLRSKDITTEPPMETLQGLDDTALAVVRGFRISVNGVGSVEFTKPVDLRGVDIDAVFQFAKRTVIVYPDDATKPPPGTKLNQPCKITIEDCFPRRRNEAASIERYRKKLEATTKGFGGSEFHYDPVKGHWSFELQHF